MPYTGVGHSAWPPRPASGVQKSVMITRAAKRGRGYAGGDAAPAGQMQILLATLSNAF